jgi:hypothetical protein
MIASSPIVYAHLTASARFDFLRAHRLGHLNMKRVALNNMALYLIAHDRMVAKDGH